MPVKTLSKRATQLLVRLQASRGGNVAIIVAVSMIPLSLAVGMGVDYTLQRQREEQLSGIADAAVLAAVTPSMMTSTPAVAQAAAQSFWNGQSATVANAAVTGTVPLPVDPPGAVSTTRTVSLNWQGQSTNIFAALLGMPTSPLGGTSSASSANAPNINFYMLIDTSPSMGIAATTGDIATMVSNTSAQGGCAFACHETNPTTDDVTGNPKGTGVYNNGIDNYTLARNLGVTLRIDLVNDAVSNLITTAVSTAKTYNTNYGISVSTIDYKVSQLYQTANLSTDQATAKSTVGSLQQLEVGYNNCVINGNCNAGGGGSDQDSYLDLGLSTLNAANSKTYTAATGPGYTMFTPGNGTKTAGDTPQEVVFIVTDSVVDQANSSGNRVYGPMNTLVDNCTKIKARGIRIAYLYLVYNPLPTNSWYNTYIAPFQQSLNPAAQSCASPGLFKPVATNDDVTAALTQLFQAAVSTAHLTH